MELGCLIVSCCLLLQQTSRSVVPPERDDVPSAGRLVDIRDRNPKLTAPRLMAEAMASPDQNGLAGKPMTLLEVLTRVPARQQQLAAVQAYWSLAAAVGDYHFCLREKDSLAELAASARPARGQPDKLESAALAAELALASARLGEADVRLKAAQVELAERVGLPAGQELPWPADVPLVEGYRTYFDVLFASRAAPPRLQLLQQTISLRRKAIEGRVEAIQASLDALDAAREGYKNNEIYAEAVASRIVQLGRQRKAFLDSVRQYNFDIAEYALNVANPNAPPASILPMLIKTKAAEQPAGSRNNTSTGVDSGSADDSADGNSEVRSVLKARGGNESGGQKRLKPPAQPKEELAQLDAADAQNTDHESYAALTNLTPPKRTHRLARLLHWDRSSPDAAAPQLTLDQCLSKVAPANRRRVIEVFWNTREQAARCQVFSDQNDQLGALYPAVLAAARRPGGAEAMLDLRAMQQATEADLLDAQGRLLERRLELAAACGRDANSKDWPLPITPPHGGRYEMKIDAQTQQVQQSTKVLGLKHTLPGLYGALEDRAEAIVRLDSERASAADLRHSAERRLDLNEPLELINRQAAESLAFLSTLTRYNLAIADYVLTILPASNPVELTSALVIQLR